MWFWVHFLRQHTNNVNHWYLFCHMNLQFLNDSDLACVVICFISLDLCSTRWFRFNRPWQVKRLGKIRDLVECGGAQAAAISIHLTAMTKHFSFPLFTPHFRFHLCKHFLSQYNEYYQALFLVDFPQTFSLFGNGDKQYFDFGIQTVVNEYLCAFQTCHK